MKKILTLILLIFTTHLLSANNIKNCEEILSGTSIDISYKIYPRVNSADVIASPTGQISCSGSDINPIVLISNEGGTSFTWTRDQLSNVTGMAGNGSGDISGMLINNTDADVTVTFTISHTVNGIPVNNRHRSLRLRQHLLHTD